MKAKARKPIILGIIVIVPLIAMIKGIASSDVMVAASQLNKSEIEVRNVIKLAEPPSREVTNGAEEFEQFMGKNSSFSVLSDQQIRSLAEMNRFQVVVLWSAQHEASNSTKYLVQSKEIAMKLIAKMETRPLTDDVVNAYQAVWKYHTSYNSFGFLLVQQELRSRFYQMMSIRLNQTEKIDKRLVSLFEKCNSVKLRDCFGAMHAETRSAMRYSASGKGDGSSMIDRWMRFLPRYREANECRINQAYTALVSDYKDSFPNLPKAVLDFERKRNNRARSWREFGIFAFPLEYAMLQEMCLDQQQRMIRDAIKIKTGAINSTQIKDFDGKTVRMIPIPNGWLMYSVGPDRVDDQGQYEAHFEIARPNPPGDNVVKFRKDKP